MPAARPATAIPPPIITLLSTIDKLLEEEDEDLDLQLLLFCGLLLFGTRHDRDVDDGTNANPDTKGESRHRREAIVDFIMGSGLVLLEKLYDFYGSVDCVFNDSIQCEWRR